VWRESLGVGMRDGQSEAMKHENIEDFWFEGEDLHVLYEDGVKHIYTDAKLVSTTRPDMTSMKSTPITFTGRVVIEEE
jgi:hypothetical protein